MKDPELETAVYEILDRRASDLRNKNVGEFGVEAWEVQKAVDAPGRIAAVCAFLEDDSLLSKAGLELQERIGPPTAQMTVFRYKVHGLPGTPSI
jgi:hypothetical protein